MVRVSVYSRIPFASHLSTPLGYARALFLIFVWACISPLQALAQGGGTYYVATSGNDSNAGTSASPWRTIQKAANTLNGGETVIVNAGTYNERVQIITSGSAGKVLTFQAQGTVVMQGF